MTGYKLFLRYFFQLLARSRSCCSKLAYLSQNNLGVERALGNGCLVVGVSVRALHCGVDSKLGGNEELFVTNDLSSMGGLLSMLKPARLLLAEQNKKPTPIG